jgi:hypothetical protein
MSKRGKQHGHFCWCCGYIKSNEKFSGRGHARHVCLDCSKLGPTELAFRQTVHNIDKMVDWNGVIRRKQRKSFERYLTHADPRVRAHAAEVAAADARAREEFRRERLAWKADEDWGEAIAGGYDVSRREEIVSSWSLIKEIESLLARCVAGESVIVGLGNFVLFCANGDAWLIDAFADDALNLMRGCTREEFSMSEDSTTLRIEWRGTSSIDGGLFVTDAVGGTRAIAGYPIQEIQSTIERLREAQGFMGSPPPDSTLG